MKKITVSNVRGCTEVGDKINPRALKFELEGNEDMDASDGYHTFTELYEHRITLYIAFCKVLQTRDDAPVWRSKLHSDGTSFEGWFVLGVNKEKGKQITYHLPMIKWGQTDFAETLEKAPEYDGHTSVDVLERIWKI